MEEIELGSRNEVGGDDHGSHSSGNSSGGGNGNSNRPSFTTFWKKSKEVLDSPRKITFVHQQRRQQRKQQQQQQQQGDGDVGGSGGGGVSGANAGSGQNVPADDQASPSKAEQRRAQVRKAQIQHRQRKANYVKTLETDAERYREMIATTRREALAIHAENEAIKAQLLQHSLKLSLDQNLFLTEQMASTPSPRNYDHEAYSMLPLEDVTMTLGYDDIMNAPCYYISSSPSSSQFGSSVNSLEGSAAPETCSAAPNPHLPEMTPQQIQQAINFILALEHICRDHSHPSLFSSSSEFPSPDEDCITGRESGHTLMATSLALRSAPSNVFQAARKTKLFPGSSISIRPPAPDSSDAVSWQASGLTLQSLYGLACSLHGKDDAEVTPVQVWFELVARYGVDAVLGAIDQMKREFIGVVKCPHYGAVLEREAFESVVGRVLGSASG